MTTKADSARRKRREENNRYKKKRVRDKTYTESQHQKKIIQRLRKRGMGALVTYDESDLETTNFDDFEQ